MLRRLLHYYKTPDPASEVPHTALNDTLLAVLTAWHGGAKTVSVLTRLVIHGLAVTVPLVSIEYYKAMMESTPSRAVP